MAIAGKIMPRPMGDYESATVYGILDIVSHNNRPWICRKADTVGIEPTTDNAEYWMLMIDVDITNADTFDGHDSTYFVSKTELSEAFEEFQLVFKSIDWVGEQAPYTQTVTAANVKATDKPIPTFVDDGDTKENSKLKKKNYGFITYFDSANGSITATCKYDRPTVDFTVSFKGVFETNG